MRLLLAQGNYRSGTIEPLAPSDPSKHGTPGPHMRHRVLAYQLRSFGLENCFAQLNRLYFILCQVSRVCLFITKLIFMEHQF